MAALKAIIEVSGGNIIAIHSDEPMDFHLVDWDNRGEDNLSWEEGCKTPISADRLIDKSFGRYMDEILAL